MRHFPRPRFWRESCAAMDLTAATVGSMPSSASTVIAFRVCQDTRMAAPAPPGRQQKFHRNAIVQPRWPTNAAAEIRNIEPGLLLTG